MTRFTIIALLAMILVGCKGDDTPGTWEDVASVVPDKSTIVYTIDPAHVELMKDSALTRTVLGMRHVVRDLGYVAAISHDDIMLVVAPMADSQRAEALSDAAAIKIDTVDYDHAVVEGIDFFVTSKLAIGVVPKGDAESVKAMEAFTKAPKVSGDAQAYLKHLLGTRPEVIEACYHPSGECMRARVGLRGDSCVVDVTPHHQPLGRKMTPFDRELASKLEGRGVAVAGLAPGTLAKLLHFAVFSHLDGMAVMAAGVVESMLEPACGTVAIATDLDGALMAYVEFPPGAASKIAGNLNGMLSRYAPEYAGRVKIGARDQYLVISKGSLMAGDGVRLPDDGSALGVARVKAAGKDYTFSISPTAACLRLNTTDDFSAKNLKNLLFIIAELS